MSSSAGLGIDVGGAPVDVEGASVVVAPFEVGAGVDSAGFVLVGVGVDAGAAAGSVDDKVAISLDSGVVMTLCAYGVDMVTGADSGCGTTFRLSQQVSMPVDQVDDVFASSSCMMSKACV